MKSKKGLFFIILLLTIIIFALIIWFYKFKVVIKYNNGLEDSIQELRFYSLVNIDDLEYHLSKQGYTLDYFYETYYLSKLEIEKLNIDTGLEKTICKDGYKLDIDNYKCISKEMFDFDKHRIVKDTIIEAMWIKKDVDDEDEELLPNINPDKDNASVSLSINKKCAIEEETITIKAKIKDATSDEVLTWSLPKCYEAKKISNESYKLKRDNSLCSNSEESTAKVTVTLPNGRKSTVKFSYEPKLSITVYDGNEIIKAVNGVYYLKSGSIKANTKVTFKAIKKSKTIKSTNNNSAILFDSINDRITIKTSCNQSKTIVISEKNN